MNPDSDPTNGTTKPTKPFRMPTREEAEERRKQLTQKPTLLFKPKGIATPSQQSPAALTGGISQSPRIATNSEAESSSRTTTTSTIATTSSSKNYIDNSNEFGNSFATKDTRGASNNGVPAIVSSQQPQQQQQQQQQHKRHADGSSDDDYGFDDDLGDVILDDDLFGLDDSPSKMPQKQPATGSASSAAAAEPAAAATGSVNATAAVPPPFIPKSKSTIVVKPSQRGNPMLQFIRNVPYEYGEIVPDFVVGLTSCIVFLSIRYHRLHPEYIFNRIAALGKTFVLRILLVLVDVDLHQQAIRELTRVAMVNDFTIVCAWSNEEAARYIETFKAYEYKAPDAIKERVDNDYLSKLTDCLTQIQSVNKTDVVTLSSTFGSFKNIMDASVDELGVLPGFGERKVTRLLEAFDQPFAIDPKKRRQRRG
ncbi:ssDNA endonuclease and repair protein rad10 [Dissophora globulifera]|uniref:DNA excision repair protein ERCC-1 n=1 Tax=Dissophora globulifera TaxID=979702 RepID=A0A9P6R940_9FUNG|nr:ssDNA endonuclease and repair protein rad10 [Dissophora globulifera]